MNITLGAIGVILKKEPAISAVLVNLGIGALAWFGWNLTPDQFIGVFAVVTALMGIVVRANVSPVTKVGEVVKTLEAAPVTHEVTQSVMDKVEKELGELGYEVVESSPKERKAP